MGIQDMLAKDKIALLFCRTVTGRNTIKEVKTLETVQRKSHKTYLEFLNGMHIMFIEVDKELDSELTEILKQKLSVNMLLR